MKGFKFRLESLLRLRKGEVVKAQQGYGEALKREMEMRVFLEKVEGEGAERRLEMGLERGRGEIGKWQRGYAYEIKEDEDFKERVMVALREAEVERGKRYEDLLERKKEEDILEKYKEKEEGRHKVKVMEKEMKEVEDIVRSRRDRI